ncbi:MAG: hypothetical protein AB7N76_18135 [Planctomycetota bacterium]
MPARKVVRGEPLGPPLDREGDQIPWFCTRCQAGYWPQGEQDRGRCPGCERPRWPRDFAVAGVARDRGAAAADAALVFFLVGPVICLSLPFLGGLLDDWMRVGERHPGPWLHPRLMPLGALLLVATLVALAWRWGGARAGGEGVAELGAQGLRLTKGLGTHEYEWDEWEGYRADRPRAVWLKRRGNRLDARFAIPVRDEAARVAVLSFLDARGLPRLD